MSDRLPTPMQNQSDAPLKERASATPVTHAGHTGKARRIEKNDAPQAAGEARPEGLRDLQHWMLAAITAPATVSDEAIARVLTRGPRLTADERLDVYRSGYYARLVECLRDDYTVLAEALGEGPFDALARAYIEAFPSSSPNLNFYGRHMATLCATVDHESFVESPETRAFAADLAALEWAMVEVLHAEAPKPFDLAALSAIPIEAWGTARLVRSDAVRLLRFSRPVNPYYQACRMGSPPAEIPAARTSATVVYRRALQLWRMDLTPAMAAVLGALLDGRTIGDALEQIGVDAADADAVAEAERSVMIWFREWVDGGMFSAVTLAE